MEKVTIYDTTLRDGTQAEGVSLSGQDKILIALKLDDLGVDYIEGGYPLSNPKDISFFKEIKNLSLKKAKVAAFGSTRKAGATPETDQGVNALLSVETPVVTVVGKSWDFHVTEVLQTTLDENLRMVDDTITYLKSRNREVVFDAEHFFDGYKRNPDYAIKVIKTAEDAGADVIALCDTNGGCLPLELGDIVKLVNGYINATLGIHAHNDSDAAVANSIIAVNNGARQVQGTINGIGERCGNADLCSVVSNLTLKTSFACFDETNLQKITDVSRYVYETVNMIPRQNQPFVGKSAFTHKGGLHAHAVAKNKETYEHIEPEKVGNERRILISELSGGASILAKTEKYSLTQDKEVMRKILNQVQELENEGYQFESAEGSFVLLVKKAVGKHKTFFELEEFRVMVEKNKDGVPISEAIVKVNVNGNTEFTVGEGDGPVHALDSALRKALENYYPSLANMRLADFKVRVINPKSGTAAKVRVVIESKDNEDIWGTVGVSENLIEASWQALVDSVEYKLLKDIEKKSNGKFNVKIDVKNWQNSYLADDKKGESIELEAVVDTEIADLALPADIIERLNLEELGKIRVYTSDAGEHEYRIMGITEITAQGKTCHSRAIELPAGSKPLLGSIPLKMMDLQVSYEENNLKSTTKLAAGEQ